MNLLLRNVVTLFSAIKWKHLGSEAIDEEEKTYNEYKSTFDFWKIYQKI